MKKLLHLILLTTAICSARAGEITVQSFSIKEAIRPSLDSLLEPFEPENYKVECEMTVYSGIGLLFQCPTDKNPKNTEIIVLQIKKCT